MAKYMSDIDIQEFLHEGLEEGTIQKAFDYLLGEWVRDIFEMKLDRTKFHTNYYRI